MNTTKGVGAMFYKFYHRSMRKLARFVLGFERCPVDCKRDFLLDGLEAAGRLVITAAAVAIICGLALFL